MADVPAVSVVIPLYNKGPYITRALNSVLAQTFQDFEVIVVDDGSTDDGAEVVSGFRDPRIRLIQQENQGVSAARNRGIEAARAELVAFLDADDEWLPEFLETVLRLRGRFPGAGAYGTAYLLKLKSTTTRVAPFSAIPQEPWEGLLPSYFKAAALGAPPLSASTVAIPRHILKKMGGFNTDAWWGEDTDLWGRIALRYPVAFSWNIGAIYHTEAVNRIPHRVMAVEENPFIATVREYLAVQDVSPELLRDLYAYIDKKRVETAVINVRSGCQSLARQQLLSCRPRSITTKWLKVFILTLLPLSIITWLLTARQRMAL